MQCPQCGTVCRRFGRDRHGRQRFQCPACPRTFTEPRNPLEDGRRLPRDRAEFVLRLLLEGAAVRSTMRLTGTDKRTILRLLVEAGATCQRFLERTVCGIAVDDVEVDEMWGFIHCKEKVRLRRGYSEDVGDSYCFVGIEGTTKLILTWHLGRRTAEDAQRFSEKLSRATSGRFQVTTDGFKPYRTAIPRAFGNRVDFAQLIKEYGIPDGEERRYSPPEVIGTSTVVCCGQPDPERICTSYVERQNLSMRMSIRRLTRLTNAFSKKWANHEAALGLYFAFYNWCRPHMTLTERMERKTTPAMAAGLTGRVWTVRELIDQAQEATMQAAG